MNQLIFFILKEEAFIAANFSHSQLKSIFPYWSNGNGSLIN